MGLERVRFALPSFNMPIVSPDDPTYALLPDIKRVNCEMPNMRGVTVVDMARLAWIKILEHGLEPNSPIDLLGVSRGSTLSSITAYLAYKDGQTLGKVLRANSPTESQRRFPNLLASTIREGRKDRIAKQRGSWKELGREAANSAMRIIRADPLLRMPRSLTRGFDSQIAGFLLREYSKGENPELFGEGFHLHTVVARDDRIGPRDSAVRTFVDLKERFGSSSTTEVKDVGEGIQVRRSTLDGLPYSLHEFPGDHAMPEQLGAEIWGGYVKELLEEAA